MLITFHYVLKYYWNFQRREKISVQFYGYDLVTPYYFCIINSFQKMISMSSHTCGIPVAYWYISCLSSLTIQIPSLSAIYTKGIQALECEQWLNSPYEQWLNSPQVGLFKTKPEFNWSGGMKLNQSYHKKRAFYRLHITHVEVRLIAVMRAVETLKPVTLKSTFFCNLMFFVQHISIKLVYICLFVLK